MINKTGLVGLNKNSSPPKTSSEGINNSLAELNNKMVIGRVTDIVLDENHPKFSEVGGWNGLGTIFFEFDNLVSSKNEGTAKSFFPQSKNYPLINEMILLFSLPNSLMGENNTSKSYYYINQINIWNHPHHNAYPNLYEAKDTTQQEDYQQTEGGSVRRVTDSSTEINLNSPLNPSQNTFIERTNIHPLLAFNGDILYEGRFGNSLRLGNTSKSNSQYTNNWSTSGKNGDPIMILRNGQPINSSEEGWIPIAEDIRKDLSSIYLSSYQKIPIGLSNENFNSFQTPPTLPSQFNLPQIIINSERIILNAKKDSVLLSAQKSIGISSNESINIEAKQIYFDGTDIRLGRKDASQAVLKGNDTVEYLKILLNELKNITEALKSIQDWPQGVPVTNSTMLTVANSAQKVFEKVHDNIDSIKSSFVKTI